jgi:hypothetical protein
MTYIALRIFVSALLFLFGFLAVNINNDVALGTLLLGLGLANLIIKDA